MGTDWRGYLASYHEDNAGITERLLSRCRDRDGTDPYSWLGSALPPTGVLCDVGCGSAVVSDHFLGRYVGVDVSLAELRVGQQLGRTGLVGGDAAALPIASGSTDMVATAMSLMVVSPIDDAVAEIARVLRPGGHLAVLLPNAWPVAPRDLTTIAALGLALRAAPQFPRRLAPRGLRDVLRRHGLTVESDLARRYAFGIRHRADAELAVDSLYLPDLSAARRDAAVRALERRIPTQLPVPLRRAVASLS